MAEVSEDLCSITSSTCLSNADIVRLGNAVLCDGEGRVIGFDHSVVEAMLRHTRAEALATAATALREAERAGCLFLGGGLERVPWQDVALWLDERAATELKAISEATHG